jgi:hypothetical protein
MPADRSDELPPYTARHGTTALAGIPRTVLVVDNDVVANETPTSRTTDHLLVIGPAPLRRHLIDSAPTDLVIDCNDGDVATAVRNAGLFTTRIRVVRGEALNDETAQQLALAIRDSALAVTVEADKLTARPERHLAAVCTVKKLSLGGAAGRSTVGTIAQRLGLTLGRETLDVLLERTSHDSGRLIGILDALAAGGYTSPTPAQIMLLAGTSRDTGLPWTLLDQIEGGDPRMIETLERLEPIPTLAFLAKRIQLAALSTEPTPPSLDEVVDAFGDTSDGAWRQATRLGRRLGDRRCRQLLGTLARSDEMAKRGHGDAALMLAAGHLALALRDDRERDPLASPA